MDARPTAGDANRERGRTDGSGSAAPLPRSEFPSLRPSGSARDRQWFDRARKHARCLRAHLHRVIDHHRLDIDHETERRGRPYTLVCTKNRASHRRRLAEYAKDVSWMRRLIRSAPAGAQAAQCAPDLARLEEAAAASARE